MINESLKNFSLLIEPTDLCNCNCIMCNRSKFPGFPFSRKYLIRNPKRGRFMSIENFQRLLSQIRDMTNYFCINEIYLHWFGEPLLHPHFLKLVEMIVNENKKDRLCKALTFHTNAILFNKAKTKHFLAIVKDIDFPFSVTFSLDAVSTTTYARIRIGGNLNAAINNTKFLLKEGSKIEKLKFIVQFIVMEENLHEAVPFVEFWSKFLKELDMKYKVAFNFIPAYAQKTHLIYLRQLDGGYKRPTQLKYNKLHAEVMRRFSSESFQSQNSPAQNPASIPKGIFYHGIELTERSFFCSNLWDAIAVCWDGSATLICDQWLALNLGNINHLHLLEIIFNRENLNHIREKHILGEIKNPIKDCQDCGIVYCEHNNLTNYYEIQRFTESEKRYMADRETNPKLGWFT